MLTPHVNPYEILSALPAAFGTNPHPKWALIFNRYTAEWSAFNCEDVDDTLAVALDPNIFAICTLDPEAVMTALAHGQPNLIADNLQSIATNYRNKASQLDLRNLTPDVPAAFTDTPETEH